MKVKQGISLVLIVCIILATTYTTAVANSTKTVSPEVELLIEEGDLSTKTAVDLQNTVDEYFLFRQNSYMADQRVMTRATEKTELENEVLKRNDSLRDFWANENVDIVNIESEAEIRGISNQDEAETLNLQVYEWTWVYYNNGKGADSEATDYMGFGTEHEIVMEKQSNGNYVIVKEREHRY